jgi:ferritin-like metal-binding protein YciE
MARYAALITWARQLGLSDAAEVLEQTLDEERATDTTLCDLAESDLTAQKS